MCLIFRGQERSPQRWQDFVCPLGVFVQLELHGVWEIEACPRYWLVLRVEWEAVIDNVSFSSRGLVREWRAESREPPGRHLYLAETSEMFPGRGSHSFHVLHSDHVAQDLHTSRRVRGAIVRGRPWLVARGCRTSEQVPALEAIAGLVRMLPTDTGALAGYRPAQNTLRG